MTFGSPNAAPHARFTEAGSTCAIGSNGRRARASDSIADRGAERVTAPVVLDRRVAAGRRRRRGGSPAASRYEQRPRIVTMAAPEPSACAFKVSNPARRDHHETRISSSRSTKSHRARRTHGSRPAADQAAAFTTATRQPVVTCRTSASVAWAPAPDHRGSRGYRAAHSGPRGSRDGKSPGARAG